MQKKSVSLFIIRCIKQLVVLTPLLKQISCDKKDQNFNLVSANLPMEFYPLTDLQPFSCTTRKKPCGAKPRFVRLYQGCPTTYSCHVDPVHLNPKFGSGRILKFEVWICSDWIFDHILVYGYDFYIRIFQYIVLLGL